MNLFVESLFWFIFAFLFALLEIEIEGPYGNGEKLQTWFRTSTKGAKIWARLQGGDALLGYRLFITIVVVMAFHIPFFMGVNWSVSKEVITFSIIYVLLVIEDFLWFVLNPFYGIENFKKENIWWHAKKKWLFGKFPEFYLSCWMISIILAYLASLLNNKPSIFWNHLEMLAAFIVLVAITVKFIAPRYKLWYIKMRELDERDKIGIFHTLPVKLEIL